MFSWGLGGGDVMCDDVVRDVMWLAIASLHNR